MEEKKRPAIALPRKHHGIVMQVLERWRQGGVLDDGTAVRLADSITVASFDWQRTARYAFIFAILCLVIAAGAVLADKMLMRLLMRLFNASAIASLRKRRARRCVAGHEWPLACRAGAHG